MRWCLLNTYDAPGSTLVLMLKRQTESCQGTCPRPHPIQQVSKTGRPTTKPSPNPGAVPTPMLSPGKQAGGPESNSHVNFKNWEPFTGRLKNQSVNPLLVHSLQRRQMYFFPFLSYLTLNTSVPPFWHTAQPTEHFHTDRVTHVMGWSHHKWRCCELQL